MARKKKKKDTDDSSEMLKAVFSFTKEDFNRIGVGILVLFSAILFLNNVTETHEGIGLYILLLGGGLLFMDITK